MRCVQYLLRRVRSHESVAELAEEPSNAPRSPQPVDGAAAGSQLEFAPLGYYDRLKETLPERSAGLWHHSVGLAWAVLETGGSLLSYLNPLSYLHSHRSKKKD